MYNITYNRIHYFKIGAITRDWTELEDNTLVYVVNLILRSKICFLDIITNKPNKDRACLKIEKYT